MTTPIIRAASWLGPEGHGNDLTGLRPWPDSIRQALALGSLENLHWSTLFDSDPARFGRMDWICRLGLMATELLDANFGAMTDAQLERIGVCLETCAGSLENDIQFVQTSRPSIFAYTLPSTAIGEVCIRYRLKGPMLCLVTGTPGTGDAASEATEWVERGDADACLCLSCDTLDPKTAAGMRLPPNVRPGLWSACALLIGSPAGASKETPMRPGTLSGICRERVCGASKTPGLPPK